MFNTFCENASCDGCSILEKKKPFYSFMDYEECGEADVLFLSDSLKYNFGAKLAFGKKDMNLLLEILSGLEGDATFEFAASVKCPSCKDGDLKAGDMKLCRTHLEATIDKVKPKLIYCCGNLPMKMLLKKSGLGGANPKRGRTFEYETPNGHKCVAVPIFHPFSVIQEPKNRFLFELDINNAYNSHILKKVEESDFKYEVLTSIFDLKKYNFLTVTCEDIAIDIETTGLDFTSDLIYTISISYDGGTIVIPFDHPECVWTPTEKELIIMFLQEVHSNPMNDKAFHNSKFDLKFLIRVGIKDFMRIVDTQLYSHAVDENTPNSLMECVNQYFPQELDSLC